MQRFVSPLRFKTAACQGFLIVAFVLLAGCSGPLVKSAITSNIVQEEAHNAYLLLNIIRAQERMPMHFTQVNTVRAAPGGIGIGTPSLALELPLGGGSSHSYPIKPSLEATSNVDSVSLVSQEFIRGITAPVDESLMVYFINQGWPPAMVFHLFVGSIEVIDEYGRAIYSVHNSPFSSTFNTFKQVVSALGNCRTTLQDDTGYVFHTPILSEGEVKNWVKDVPALKTAGLLPVQVDKEGDPLKAGAGPSGLIRYASRSKEAVLVFTQDIGQSQEEKLVAKACYVKIQAEAETVVENLMNEFRRQNKERLAQSAAKTHKPSMHVRFVMRSTQSMLYFLGELNRAYLENYPPLTIPVRANLAAQLFVAKHCDEALDAAVTVQYRSVNYCVGPSPAATAVHDASLDRSLQTLALVSLVYGLQNEGGEAPAIRNVRIIP